MQHLKNIFIVSVGIGCIFTAEPASAVDFNATYTCPLADKIQGYGSKVISAGGFKGPLLSDAEIATLQLHQGRQGDAAFPALDPTFYCDYTYTKGHTDIPYVLSVKIPKKNRVLHGWEGCTLSGEKTEILTCKG